MRVLPVPQPSGVSGLLRRCARWTIPACVLLAGAASHGTAGDRIGTYEFGYETTGDARVRPVQVFDDGRSTFFQFRSSEPIPAIFVVTTSGPVLSMPELQGPYVKVASVAGGFMLRMGHGVGQVKFLGGGRGAMPAGLLPAPTPQAAAHAQSTTRLLAAAQQINGLPSDMFAPPPPPRLELNSYATPIRGDRVEWAPPPESLFDVPLVFAVDSNKLSAQALKAVKSVAPRAARAARVEVTGRDDMSHRDGAAEARAAAVVQALVQSGVPRAVITMKTTVEVVEAGRGSIEGAYIRVVERSSRYDAQQAAAAQPSGPASVEEIVRRLQTGQLTPSAAVELLQRAGTASSGVPGTPPSTASGGAPRAWALRKSDETIQKVLERWGREAGWRVVWERGPVIHVTGEAQLERLDFLQAADVVVKQSRAAGYRLKATAHSNQVLHIEGE
ncbi:MAG: TrbG/VirB9 family P-type conjugative transfer protein [Vicinamibacterales bacterium]